MSIVLLIPSVIVWAAWKLLRKPRRTLDGLVKAELFNVLRHKASADKRETVSAERIERAVRWRINLLGLTVFVLCFLTVGAVRSFTVPAFMIACGIATLCHFYAMRSTHQYRTVLVPLYLTLCRIPSATWDPTARPKKWIQLPNRRYNDIVVRLPRDVHASRIMLGQIRDIVTSRVAGEWDMTTDTANFRVQFTRPVIHEVQTVDVPYAFIEDDGLTSISVKLSDEDGPW